MSDRVDPLDPLDPDEDDFDEDDFRRDLELACRVSRRCFRTLILD